MKYFLPVLIAVVAVVGVAFGYTKLGGAKNSVCDQQYALCTSAQCVPDPDDPNKAICFCEVHEGKNLGKTACDKRVPFTDQNGVRHVTSTFSFDDFATKKTMTCPSGKPWTDCLDQPCTVDPMDPSKAICMCKVVRTGTFQTAGGNCDQSTCETGYWSAATLDSNTEYTQILMKALGLKLSPQRLCPQ